MPYIPPINPRRLVTHYYDTDACRCCGKTFVFPVLRDSYDRGICRACISWIPLIQLQEVARGGGNPAWRDPVWIRYNATIRLLTPFSNRGDLVTILGLTCYDSDAERQRLCEDAYHIFRKTVMNKITEMREASEKERVDRILGRKKS